MQVVAAGAYERLSCIFSDILTFHLSPVSYVNKLVQRYIPPGNTVSNIIPDSSLLRGSVLCLLILLTLPSFAASVAITTGSTGAKYPGKFIWADLVTSNPEKAASFYEAVFGWQATSIDGNYIMLTNQGRPVAGIARNKKPEQDENQNQWISFFSVRDIDNIHQKLTSSGAQVVVAPAHVEGRGDFGIYVAPDSAVFGTLDSSSGDPEETELGLNDWIWIELWSVDTSAAAEFYDVLGYEILDNWHSTNDQDLLLAVGDIARAGLVEAHESQTKSIWLAYILVESVEETIERTLKAGGKTHSLKGEKATSSNIALIIDPTGGLVAIYEFDDDMGETENE